MDSAATRRSRCCSALATKSPWWATPDPFLPLLCAPWPWLYHALLRGHRAMDDLGLAFCYRLRIISSFAYCLMLIGCAKCSLLLREQKLSTCTSCDVSNLSYTVDRCLCVWISSESFASNHLNFLSLDSSTSHECDTCWWSPCTRWLVDRYPNNFSLLLPHVWNIPLVYIQEAHELRESLAVFFQGMKFLLFKTEQLCICCFYGCVCMCCCRLDCSCPICASFPTVIVLHASLIYVDRGTL